MYSYIVDVQNKNALVPLHSERGHAILKHYIHTYMNLVQDGGERENIPESYMCARTRNPSP